MSWQENLEIGGNAAAILTFAGGAWAYGSYRYAMWRMRRQLEDYLKRARGSEFSKRTILRMMADLGMTESEILQASFQSKAIARSIAPDPRTRRAAAILFEYSGSN